MFTTETIWRSVNWQRVKGCFNSKSFSREGTIEKETSQSFTVNSQINFWGGGGNKAASEEQGREMLLEHLHKQGKYWAVCRVPLAGSDFHQHTECLGFREQRCTKSVPKLQHFCYPKDVGED